MEKVEKQEVKDEKYEPQTQVLKDVKSSKLNVFQIFSVILGFVAIFTCFFWYICIPTGAVGIILANVGNKKSGIKKADYKMMINVVGIILSFVIIVIEIFFASLVTNYTASNYSINFNRNWQRDESRTKLKLIYRNDEDMYLVYDKSYNLTSNINVSKKSDRESLYENYYNKYQRNAGDEYYISSDVSEFHRVSLFSNNYIAYISYINYNGGYGRFYIVVSDTKVITFKTYSAEKQDEEKLHKEALNVIKSVEILTEG